MKNNNQLYPIFLKLHELNLLIVGAGAVGFEKLQFILKSSPEANITVVAKWISPEVYELLDGQEYRVRLIQKAFEAADVLGHNLIIAATDDRQLNEQLRFVAKKHGKLINVADTPALCDFYLGAIVTKGSLKIAISTNGQSPTFAKRFRQLLEDILPEELDSLIDNLKTIRDRLQGGFANKVKQLNVITSALVEEDHPHANNNSSQG